MLRVIDAEIVWVDAPFYLCDLVELLGHGISDIQFSVEFWKIVIESFEDDWLRIIGRRRLGDEVLELLEARIIEFIGPPLVQYLVEFLSFQEVNIMCILIVFCFLIIFLNDHDNNIEQSLLRFHQFMNGDNLIYVTFIESLDVIYYLVQSCILIF